MPGALQQEVHWKEEQNRKALETCGDFSLVACLTTHHHHFRPPKKVPNFALYLQGWRDAAYPIKAVRSGRLVVGIDNALVADDMAFLHGAFRTTIIHNIWHWLELHDNDIIMKVCTCWVYML